MTQDLQELIASLVEHNVEFLVVGSAVLAFYGRPRYTEDIDFWLRKSRENVDRLADALTAFGTPVNRNALYVLADQHDKMIVLGSAPQAVDILNHIAGLDFEEAWTSRMMGTLFGSEVAFLSKEDFIKSKRAAGRKKDLLDLAILEEMEG